MARNGLRALVSVGLSATTLVFSFLGCGSLYEDVSTGSGTCEDDNNPCTLDSCATGATMHTPTADGEACALGTNVGKCSAGSCLLDCLTGADGMAGACNCTSDSECPTDEQCATWACTMGQCTRSAKPDGELVGTLEMKDCKKVVCEFGIPKTVQDDTDTTPNVPNDCQKYVCENMGEKSIADDTDVPLDSKGDCKKPACSNGAPMPANDDTDAPDDTGCVDNTCVNGNIVPMNAPVGTDCDTGVCNTKGSCVDCLPVAEWTACGATACGVNKCDGEVCAAATECHHNACSDGVCCNVGCTDECKSCNLNNSKGTCTNIPYYQEDILYTPSGGGAPKPCTIAAGGQVCNGNAKCLKIVNIACNADAQCISNKCVNLKCQGATGEACSGDNAECASNMCVMGACK